MSGYAPLTSTTDNLGAVRPAGRGPDRGAYELGALLPSADAGGPPLGDGGSKDTSAPNDAGASRDDASASADGSGGCGCRTSPAGADGVALLAGTFAVVAAAGRWRRRTAP